MEKRYEMIYHFKDGTAWDQENIKLNSKEIAFALDSLYKTPDIEIQAISTGESKKVRDIVSIELKV